MQYTYLAALLVSFAGMMTIDYRYQLAAFSHPTRTMKVVAAGVGLFVVWDMLGIALGIFFSGRSDYMSGWYLAPEFPVEEIIFLTFLCYFVLVIYRFGEKIWPRTS